MLFVIRAIFIAACLITALFLAIQVFKSKRRLDRRVEEFKEELADGGGAAANPYLALAELYAEEERRRNGPGRST